MKEIWEGDWDRGFELDFGVFILPDERRYEGFWKQCKQNGKGIYYAAKLKIEKKKTESKHSRDKRK